MSRFNGNSSYGHRIEDLGGAYRVHSTKDHYYAGSRLRFPKVTSRDTDLKGAVRFAKKHGLTESYHCIPDAVRAVLG